MQHGDLTPLRRDVTGSLMQQDESQRGLARDDPRLGMTMRC
jgi:hypothetical protein